MELLDKLRGKIRELGQKAKEKAEEMKKAKEAGEAKREVKEPPKGEPHPQHR